MGRSVSIQDIAQAAGVSHTTVSRALRNSPVISLEVREQIQQLAQDMGYIPNAVAQSLKRKQTNTVGLVVTTISDPFVGRVVRGIEDIAQKYNISVFLSVSNNDPNREMAVIETFHQRRVDGIIVSASQISAQYEKRLAQISIPTVLINYQAETTFDLLHSVTVDDYSGARLAVECLIQLGHQAIGYLGTHSRPRSNRVRLQGYKDALAAAGITAEEAWVKISPLERSFYSNDVVDGQYYLPSLIRSGVTSVFCYNDMMAIGALTACHSLGIVIPEQFSIIGFDDIEIAQYVTPSLTTVHQPRLRLGQLGMEMLLDLIANRQVEDHILPTELIWRGSAGRVSALPIKPSQKATELHLPGHTILPNL